MLGLADEHLAPFLADPAGFARLAAHTCPAAAAPTRADLAASGIPTVQDSVLRATFLRKFPVTCARILPDLCAFTAAHLVVALMNSWYEVAVEMLLRYAVQDSTIIDDLDGAEVSENDAGTIAFALDGKA